MDRLTRLALDARTGDRGALEAFVREAQADVWRLGVHLAGRQHADDVVQETFERALRSLPRFEASASARTWLLVIARRVCADKVRRNVRGRRLHQRLVAQMGDPGVEDPAATRDLFDLLDHLDLDRREAFVLTQVLGLSYAEAAEVTDVPVGTIRSRVSRARSDLVALLAERGGGAADALGG